MIAGSSTFEPFSSFSRTPIKFCTSSRHSEWCFRGTLESRWRLHPIGYGDTCANDPRAPFFSRPSVGRWKYLFAHSFSIIFRYNMFYFIFVILLFFFLSNFSNSSPLTFPLPFSLPLDGIMSAPARVFVYFPAETREAEGLQSVRMMEQQNTRRSNGNI